MIHVCCENHDVFACFFYKTDGGKANDLCLLKTTMKQNTTDTETQKLTKDRKIQKY